MADDTPEAPAPEKPAESTTLETHQECNRSLSKQPGITSRSVAFVGDYDELAATAAAWKVGITTAANNTGFVGFPDGYVSAVELQALKGGRGRLIISTAEQDDVAVWGLEMAEIQKPIRNWHATEAEGTKPDTALLAGWENQKGIKDLAKEYDAYRYNGQALTGETLTLAKMIREEGIEYYVVFTPIITLTTRHNGLPSGVGSNIGKIETPKDAPEGLSAIATEWLKTADRIQGSIDGVYTRIQQWTGADKWNPNLYETAESGSSSSGSDSGSGGSSSNSGGSSGSSSS
ncbi:MAG: hypothetical protein ACI4YA_06140 [Candidatus Spyradenecus sp.]